MFGREDKVSPTRMAIVQYAIVALFLLLGFGLWRLQVMRNDYYDTLAQQNRIKEVPILAPRGKILDREGRIIVDNYPSFSALLLRSEGKLKDSDLDMIAAGLHLDPDELKQRVKRLSATPGYQPIFVKYDITPDELAFIESHRNELPMLDTITVHRRLYPKSGFMAHLIGYVGEVSEDMLNQPRYELYNPGDVVGQSGVEAQYNDVLMGKNGSRRVLVNSKGKEVGELSDTPAVPGKQLKLTVDIDLQIAAEQALEGKNGAIIAIDPRTGEVLALVSRPTFDPNAFAVRISRKDWNALVSDPAKPLLNKATQAQLAPGSVFKIIMAVAGWQEGIAQTLHVNCPGGATFYGRYFKCWISKNKGTHGSVDLAKGIYQSCDVFFYTLAERLGIDKIAAYATKFGLGQKTGIDLPQEVSGVMPSEEWKIRNFKQKWYAGETISVGIGQGAVATTPVQLLRAISAIASDGRMVRPHVANPAELPGHFKEVLKYDEVSQIEMDPKGWEAITDAMAQVVAPGGTAALSRVEGVDMAGKTGSAQTISNTLKAKIADKSAYKDNGWFAGVAPRRNPEIAVVALFEGGEHGSDTARLVAQVMKAYYEKKNHRGLSVAKAASTEQQGTGAAEHTATPNPAPEPQPSEKKSVDVTGIWSSGSDDEFQGGKISVDLNSAFRRADSAPGIDAKGEAGNRKDRTPKQIHYTPGVIATLPAPLAGGKAQ